MASEQSGIGRTDAIMDKPCARKLRSHGLQARERILLAALRLFVARGYAGTSVRDIAHEAGVNVAAIAYYFSDKAGLYRTALYEPVRPEDTFDAFDAGALNLGEALRRYLRYCLQPLQQGEASLLCVRLRFRESFEPTGMLDQGVANREALHQRLLGVLAREAGMAHPDTELEALAFSILALVVYPYVGHDRMRAVCPELLDGPGALERWVDRLADYALAMVAIDMARRESPT